MLSTVDPKTLGTMTLNVDKNKTTDSTGQGKMQTYCVGVPLSDIQSQWK